MIFWIAPVLGYLSNKADDYLDFLRSIPSLLAPKPTPASAPYTPPFTGGQSVGVAYNLFLSYEILDAGNLRSTVVRNGAFSIVAPLKGVTVIGEGSYLIRALVTHGAASFEINLASSNAFFPPPMTIRGFNPQVERVDGQPDTGGNLPNPNPSQPIADDGLFNPSNPHIGDDNGTLNPSSIVLAPAFPLALIAAILGGYSAALAAARAAASALEAIQKVAEALEGLRKLWDKLKEFLDEWEKNRPKKRDIVRQVYGQIEGDGALDFFPDNNAKFKAIQLDVVITNIPVGYGRYFGSSSPSRYRYRELGYIAFYSVNQGILETHSIQFKRTSYQIPELAVGFIYHLGLDEQIKGFAFGTFSVEKT